MRLALLCSVFALSAISAQESLAVHLPDQKGVVQLTTTDLRTLGTDTVTFQVHGGERVTYRAVSLASILRRVGTPLDSLRVGRRAWVVLATSRDGYVVVFSAAELEAPLGPTRALLAIETLQGTLPQSEGPFRLLVLTDGRPPRSSRQVVSLRVVAVPISG